jgi:hypothetical protein
MRQCNRASWPEIVRAWEVSRSRQSGPKRDHSCVDQRWIGLTKSLAKRLPDKRDPDKIEHSLESLLRQRIYGLAPAYEDLNDHNPLRRDLLWRTADKPRALNGHVLRLEPSVYAHLKSAR